MKRLALSAAAALVGLTAAPVAPAAASTVPLGPHEQFGGTVNAAGTGATIRVACAGRTGHPVAGQTVSVFIPEAMTSPRFGRTGDPARAIVVSIDTGRGPAPRVARVRRLDRTRPLLSATRPLPTWPTLPCTGRARVVFTPVPATAGARAATVDVTFAPAPMRATG